MRRITWLLAVVMIAVIVLTSCGQKSEEDVVQDLKKLVDGINSYSAEGAMILYSGEQPQEYQLTVWYQKPEFYRIAITNKQKNITQIVLKNEEGVFVLTPHLQKSFRFRSEWPNNQGQIYLYQSLLRSIVDDAERAVTKDGDSYVFDVKANYQNMALPRQKIWLKQDGYAPVHVELLDENDKPIVTVDFSSFEFDKKFEQTNFDMKWNLTSWNMTTLPTMSPLPASGEWTDKVAQELGDFGIIYPAYVPQGVELADVEEIQLGDVTAVMLRYVGPNYSYTILESRPLASPVFLHETTVANLGFTLGVLTGEEQKTLIWFDDQGVEYRMTMSNLPEDEMIKIAQSVQGQVGK